MEVILCHYLEKRKKNQNLLLVAVEKMQVHLKFLCCCGEKIDNICCIKVLGAGCASCHEQYEQAKKAVESMGLSIEVEYIADLEKVMSYGVMSMPAIVVNDKVISMGKVLKANDVVKLLQGM